MGTVVEKTIMRSLLLIGLIIGVASAFPKAEPEDCELCRKSVHLMWGHLREDENMEIEANVLIESVCANTKNPEDCAAGIEVWWPTLAQIFYADATVPYVCEGISEGQCERPSLFNTKAVPAFHCDTCRADVTRAANAYNHANAVESWITTLEGEAFCKNPELGFTEEQIYECDAAIKEFVGPAMAALGQGIAGAADTICRDWFECNQDHSTPHPHTTHGPHSTHPHTRPPHTTHGPHSTHPHTTPPPAVKNTFACDRGCGWNGHQCCPCKNRRECP